MIESIAQLPDLTAIVFTVTLVTCRVCANSIDIWPLRLFANRRALHGRIGRVLGVAAAKIIKIGTLKPYSLYVELRVSGNLLTRPQRQTKSYFQSHSSDCYASCETVIMPLAQMLRFLCSGDIRPAISAPLESSHTPQIPPLYTLEDMELRLARMHAENPISIQPAECKHITSMARIHLAAFHNDDLVKFLYSNDIHWVVINKILEEHLKTRPYAISVAINEKPGCVVGWLCCSVVGHPGAPKWDIFAQLEWTVAAAFKAAEAHWQLTRSSGESEHIPRYAQRMTLQEAIVSRTKVAQSLAMGDGIYLVINNLATDPHKDLGGVTSKLICSITESADKDRLSVFAQVPSFALADFEWAGFEHIAGFEPLRDIHQLKFMVRRPKAP